MMLLVTGASGVGKSTVRALIAEELAPQVRAVELTQIAGPPTYQRGWRQRAVEKVVQVALAEQESGRHDESPVVLDVKLRQRVHLADEFIGWRVENLNTVVNDPYIRVRFENLDRVNSIGRSEMQLNRQAG